MKIEREERRNGISEIKPKEGILKCMKTERKIDNAAAGMINLTKYGQHYANVVISGHK